MAKRKNTGTKEPTREEWRKFAADKFKWLRQVALNLELPRIASQFAVLLLDTFNLEFGGIGWAGQDTLAKKLGCHRITVNRLFTLFVKHEHLTYQRGGWGRSNRYRMVLKEEAPDVAVSLHQEQPEEAPDVTVSLHQEQPPDVAVSLQPDVAVSLHESLIVNDGATTLPPERERAAPAAAAGGPASYRRPPRRQKRKKASKPIRC